MEFIDQLSDMIDGDVVAEGLILFLCAMPSFGIKWLYKWQKTVSGWRRWGAFGGIIALVMFILCVPVAFTLYAMSRKITALKTFFTWLSGFAPTISEAIAERLNAEVLPAPKLWHMLVFAGIGIGVYFCWLKFRRRTVARPTANPVIKKTKNAPKAPDPVLPAKPAKPQAPPQLVFVDADQKPTAPEVRSVGGLLWRKNANVWQPQCPKCNGPMGITEIMPQGMVMKTGGAQTPVAVATCSIPNCNAFRRDLPLRGSALQNRVQQDYDRQKA
jgi:hypothetical protein